MGCEVDKLPARIARGEAALDAYDLRHNNNHQWFERIKRLDQLNMEVRGQRILDQLFGDYLSGLLELEISTTAGYEYGFANETSAEASAQTEGWKTRVCTRLSQKARSPTT